MYKHTELVVRVSGGNFYENGSVTLDKSGHDPSSSLDHTDIEGKRGNDNLKKKILSLLRGVAGEYGGVDALVGLLADEKVGNKFDDTKIRVEMTKTI